LGFDLTTLMFSSPANGSVFIGPTNVTLAINNPLETVDGNVVSVDFYAPRYPWSPSEVQLVGSADSEPFALTVPLTPGIHVYRAAVKNHSGQLRGVPPVVFAVRPPNDNFSESILLEPIPGITRGWVGGASWEAGERRPLKVVPNTGSSWWVWTAPETGQFRLQINTPSSLVLYKGSAFGALKSIAKFGGGDNVFAAVGGETYHLQAYSSAGLFDDWATIIEFALSR
jgi:hypothetical protein